MKSDGASLMLAAMCGLLLHCAVHANVIPAAAEYPYRGIMDRNIFGLKPSPPVTRPEDIKPPVPDLNLTGITTILGNKRALLKVPAKPPQRPKEEFFILAEGQSEGEIEVLAIDEVAETVKVNNHGSVQTLDFINNGLKVAGGPSIANPPPGIVIPPPAAPGLRQIPPRPMRQVLAPGNYQPPTPAPANNPPPSAGPGVGPNPSEAALNLDRPTHGFTQTPDFGITPDEQTLLIEANRAALIEQGRDDEASMIPPTDLTPQQGQELLTQ